MRVSKVFIKKNRRGNILKIVREHYLRDDIWCGSEVCDVCSNGKSVLKSTPTPQSKLCDKPYYIVPDTNVLLHQIDVLECNHFCDVIILQTVMDEVKHRSAMTYKRLKDLISNSQRRFYVFVNEHHKETFVQRKKGETSNDRNDKAIRKACVWYKQHLKRHRIEVLLLSDDEANRKLAEKENLLAYSIAQYAESVDPEFNIVDKIAKLKYSNPSDFIGKHNLYPEHIAPSALLAGIKNKRYLQGTFYASKENYLEGFVSCDDDSKILVQGLINLNRAVQNDIVAVELFSSEQWSGPSDLVLEDVGDDPGETVTQTEIESEKRNKDVLPTGKIVGVIRRKWRPYCGILQLSPIPSATRHIFVPAERCIPKIRIETRQGELLSKQKIIVVIDSWPRNSRYPLGHFVRNLGEIGDKNTENEVLLLEHDIPHSTFSEAVLACLPTLPWAITEEDLKSRVDLRGLDICSVDPPGCTDIDDALHCKRLPNGNFDVGVHIADVSHFIRPNTALDAEATSRGNTVYLVDKRIDMVPDLLSSNLCSLRGNEERFAFSCVWEITPDANVVSTKFHKSVIRSRAALTYHEAQALIDDVKKTDNVTASLRQLNKFAKILKQRRLDKGALLLASPEVRFQIDDETHDPIDVETKEMKDTNSLVEEFMLLANISAAQKILEFFPECSTLRRHPTPPLSNFDPLIKAAKSKNLEINIDNGKALSDSLDKAVVKDNPYFNTMLRILTTRCMMQAVYFCSGTLEASEYVHYGLACPIYTHFTSPIRRYSDILVHRLLAVSINADSTYPELLDKKKTESVCNNLNYRHKMAQYAGRASVHLHTKLFLKDKLLEEEGYILFIRKNALQILVPKYGIEGVLFLSKENEPSLVKFTFNEDEPSQSWDGGKFRIFDKVKIQLSLDISNIQHEKVILKLLLPQIAGFSVPLITSAPREERKVKKLKKL